MSILIICNYKDPKPWEEALKSKLPNVNVSIYPDIKDSESVEFIVCWKPEPYVLEQFPNVKVIHSIGAAVDHITYMNDIPKDCRICRIVDHLLTQDLWEFVLAGVMSHLKRFNTYTQQQSNKIWKPLAYKSIRQTTVSILGLGQIGAYVAEQFGNLGFKVRGWSASEKNIPGVISCTGPSELALCLKGADFLINILPNTKTTVGILNETNLRNLNRGAYLINVGRGEHLVEEDLITLIENRFLSGALLDVFKQEPLPQNDILWSHPNFITLTPHIASLSEVDSASNLIVENYHKHKTGKRLLHSMSPDQAY